MNMLKDAHLQVKCQGQFYEKGYYYVGFSSSFLICDLVSSFLYSAAYRRGQNMEGKLVYSTFTFYLMKSSNCMMMQFLE